MSQPKPPPDAPRTRKHHVAFGVTAPETALCFLKGQMGYLVERGLQVSLVCPEDPRVRQLCSNENVDLLPVRIERKPTWGSEIRALIDIYSQLHKARPSTVILGTPKMALLGMAVSFALRVPQRIYLVHGLRYEGAKGIGSIALKTLEFMTLHLSTRAVAVSPSVAKKVRHINPNRTVEVLGDGSPNGVDLDHFHPPTPTQKAQARAALDVDQTSDVVAFVGRITGDKGLAELTRLANSLQGDQLLLIAGSREANTPTDQARISELENAESVRFLGHLRDPSIIYHAADMLVLPTKREGLPTVVIEAAASALPTVSYAVTGCVDAILDQDTGALIPHGDADGFVSRVVELLADEPTRSKMGESARTFVEDRFDQHRIWALWYDYLTGISRS